MLLMFFAKTDGLMTFIIVNCFAFIIMLNEITIFLFASYENTFFLLIQNLLDIGATLISKYRMLSPSQYFLYLSLSFLFLVTMFVASYNRGAYKVK